MRVVTESSKLEENFNLATSEVNMSLRLPTQMQWFPREGTRKESNRNVDVLFVVAVAVAVVVVVVVVVTSACCVADRNSTGVAVQRV